MSIRRRDPATYIPYISPAREDARIIRNEARYQADQQAGICSDSFQGMQGLNDIEYCYFLKVGNFMPSKSLEVHDGTMNGDPSRHDINKMLESYKKEQEK